MTGTCHHWDPRRRFGKVTGADRRVYFVHVDELVDVLHLAPGQRVEFAPSLTARGLRATAVRPFEPVTSPAEEGWTCPAA